MAKKDKAQRDERIEMVELIAPADTTAIGVGDGISYEVTDGKVQAKPEHVEVLLRHGCSQAE